MPPQHYDAISRHFHIEGFHFHAASRQLSARSRQMNSFRRAAAIAYCIISPAATATPRLTDYFATPLRFRPFSPLFISHAAAFDIHYCVFSLSPR